MASVAFDVWWRDHGAKAGFKGLSAEARAAAKAQDEFKARAALAGAVVGAALFKMGKDAIRTASDIGESTSKVGVVFGKAGASVLRFADTSAKGLGISKAAALEAAGTFGNLFVSLKLPQAEAAKMSTRMVQLAADMASFNNTSPEEALDALRSGLVGETEPLRRFGVNIQDAQLRQEALKLGLISTTKDALSPAAKAQASYSLILQQTTTAQGDFARTSGGLANQQRILTAEFSDLQGQLGQKLLPAVVKTTSALVDVLTFVGDHGHAVAALAIGVGGLATAVYSVNKASAAFKATSQAWDTVTGAIRGLNAEGSKSSRILSAVGGPGGALGILGGALAIGGVAWAIYAKKQAESKARIDSVRESLDQQTGAITGNTRELAFSTLKQQGAIDAAKVLGISLQDLTDAALGNADAQARVKDRITDVIGPMDQYRVLTGQQVEAIKKVRGAVGENNDELNKAKRELEDQRAAGIKAAEGTETLTGALQDNTAAAKDNTDQYAHRDAILSKRSAQRDYEQAVDDLTQALKDNGKTLDLGTEKGRANAEALDRLAGRANEYRDSAKKAGDSTARLNGIEDDAYKRLYNTARQLGLSKTAADRYAASVLGIPPRVTTPVTTPGSKQANAELEALRRHLLALPTSVGIRVGVTSSGRTGVTAVAHGGAIGSGVGTVDEVPLLAMRGEHMWTTREVAGVGGHGAMFRLRRAAREGRLRGYAAGGIVSRIPISERATGGAQAAAWAEDYLTAAARKALMAMGGGSLGGTGWARQWAAVRSAFPWASLLSSYRPGSVTVSGNRSYHAIGRAIDVTPSMQIFDWIRSNYGARSKELIYTPAGSRQIKDGRPHIYSGPVAAQHYSHVHWAYDRGGVAGGAGWLPKMTSRPERVLSPRQTSAFENLVQVLDRSGGTGNVTVQLIAPNYVGPVDSLKRALTDLARTGQLAATLRAAGVNV